MEVTSRNPIWRILRKQIFCGLIKRQYDCVNRSNDFGRIRKWAASGWDDVESEMSRVIVKINFVFTMSINDA